MIPFVNIENHPVIFEEPERVKPESAWIEHIPFAFFLVDILKPETIVELGVHTGNSYNAFCQAVKTLQAKTSCYGIDNWQGEAHAGYYDDEVFQELSNYQKSKYSNFSILLKCTFDEGLNHFADNSIDLLHIDGLHTYKAVKHDFETWFPKLKEGGVVIFHDTQVKQQNFGVWKLWGEISGKYHSYEFKHSYGLGVIVKGNNPVFQSFLNEIKNDIFLQKLFPFIGKKILARIEEKNISQKKEIELERIKKQVIQLESLSAKNQDDHSNPLQVELDLYKSELDGMLQQLITTQEELSLSRQHINNLNGMVEHMRLKSRLKRLIKFFVPKFIRPLLKTIFRKLFSKKKFAKDYSYSIKFNKEQVLKEIKNFKQTPLISIIIPVYNVDPIWLEKAIASVKKQYYNNWELCIVDDCSTNEKTRKFLKGIFNHKIKVKFLDKNVNISGASNAALKISSGRYVALLDNDDELTPDALFEVVKTINETGAEFIYSDEDKLDMEDNYCQPHFKANFSLDLLLSQNYICHFAVIKKEIVEQVGGFGIGLEGSQDYDLFLKCIEKTNKIQHIPKVLYHWRMIPGSTASEFSSKSYAQDAGRMALENYLKRNNIEGSVYNGSFPGSYRVKRKIIGNPLISILIPFKDKPELLKACIDSILGKSTYDNYEIVGISNNSMEDSTFDLMSQYENTDKRIKFHQYNVPFNYSKINNYACTVAKGEHLILLNNDIEIISPDWIQSLLEHSQRADVGAVGAKLYYPDGRIQHAGIAMGILGLAGHLHKLFPGDHNGYFGRLSTIQNVSAVTGACLMVKKKIYEEVQGLDEVNLSVAFNDVDFCLRLREAGYLNIYTPFCEAYHHESISRGYEDTFLKKKRFQSEVEYVWIRHRKILKEGDPYYNSNLTLEHEDFSLKK